ncbi:MAG: DnaJ domain-containing protein, partial [Myxococcota bacterium]
GRFEMVFGTHESPFASVQVNLLPLVLPGIRNAYSLRRLVKLMGSEKSIPTWKRAWDRPSWLVLHPVETQMLQALDGTKSLAQLEQEVDGEPLQMYALLYALHLFEYVQFANPASRAAMPQQRARTGTAERVSKTPRQRTRTGTSERVSAMSFKPARSSAEVAKLEQAQSSKGSKRKSMRATMTLRAMRAFQPGKGVLYGQSPEQEPTAALSAQQLEQKRDQIRTTYQTVMTQDYFSILQLSEQASELEIRRAYQSLRSQFSEEIPHALRAEMQSQVQEILQILQEAYEVLGEPSLRAQYNQHRVR